MEATLAQIAGDVRAIRLLLENDVARRRRKKVTGLPPEVWEQHERTQRMLAERIAYHEARIAARERGEDPDAATA